MVWQSKLKIFTAQEVCPFEDIREEVKCDSHHSHRIR
jgi:hypothetical protein